jgi:hypothetical protein
LDDLTVHDDVQQELDLDYVNVVAAFAVAICREDLPPASLPDYATWVRMTEGDGDNDDDLEEGEISEEAQTARQVDLNLVATMFSYSLHLGSFAARTA